MVRQTDIDEANKEENKMTHKGMNWERSCTDCWCCLVFVAFLAAMIAVTALGLKDGDPSRIITPFDSVGNRCGAEDQGVEIFGDQTVVNSTDYTEYPYKYFTNLNVENAATGITNIWQAVCVKECPADSGVTPECKPNSEREECPEAQYGTVVQGTFCVPAKDDVKEIFQQVYKAIGAESNFGKYMADLQKCWKSMAAMCGMTFFVALGYIFLLKWITKPLLYVSMVAILVSFILLGGWSWMRYTEYDPVTQKDDAQYA